MTKNVLVTGGAGFVGSHACKALARGGFVPVAYDNLSSGHDWAVKWGPLERGDLIDRDRLRAVLAAHEPVAVLHFAAHAYVGESVTEPEKYYTNNISGTLSLLSSLREVGPKAIVFSSSCAVYGRASLKPICEDDEMRPVNPYGFTKLVVEQMLRDFGHAYGLRSVSLRYFNASGADPDGEIGEDHCPETHLIPLVLDVALGRQSAIRINGTDYETPDGTCVRDFVHVSDLAAAHVMAVHKLDDLAGAASYNLGTGKGSSVKEVIGVAQEVTRTQISAVEGPRRSGDPAVLVADPQLAFDELRWRPQYPELRTQIEDAWRWRKQRLPRSS